MGLLSVAKKLALPVGVVGGGVAGFLIWDDQRSNLRHNVPHRSVIPPPAPLPPSRAEMLKALSEKEYDVLVIGGGATGTGVAWDAALRGLKTALVERDDFASATSSRSTKLVHGGVRYLEKAFWQADIDQFMLVKEALAERKHFVDMAPHLAFPLPIMIPLYKWWQLPYYYAGVKAYDAIAGRANLESSYLLTRSRALQLFPMLNDSQLKGAVVYYDGSHNDARTNASLAVTAAEHGADILNHVEVVSLIKDEEGKLCGAEVVDREDLTADKPTFTIKTKAIVNATGPFTDSIRKMDDQAAQNIAIASSGVHIVLPGYYCPKNMGLLDPATSDGRVVFFLPWQGSTIAGTTDRPATIEPNPTPSEDDITFILNEVRHYIDGKIDVKREDVRAAWSGIRPLVKDPHALDTQNVVRNHTVHVSDSGLVTIAGGKWTTFREMAEETVDTVVKTFGFGVKPCQTKLPSAKVVGAEGWHPLLHLDLIQHFGIEPISARHLSENYGVRAFDVARLCAPSALDTEGNVVQRNSRLSPLYPFLDGEVHYALKYEYATSVMDILARRTRLAFLDAQAAREALPAVIDIMGVHFGWDVARQEREYTSGLNYLISMGLREQPLHVTSPTTLGTITTIAPASVTAPSIGPGDARSQ